MNKERKEMNQSDKKISNKKKLCYSIAALLVVVALIAGFSYAWFYNQTDMATLMEIKPPATISILGPNGSEMTSLDLSDGEKKEGTVTVRRVICIRSEAQTVSQYKLEIAHTTNLKGLTFNLYPVSSTGSNTVEYNYKYDPGAKLEGNYINLQEDKTGDYKYASDTKHEENYDTYNQVQAHAEPLYWKVTNSLIPATDNQVTVEGTTYNQTYYVCEVSWTETTKETDIFYILVETA